MLFRRVGKIHIPNTSNELVEMDFGDDVDGASFRHSRDTFPIYTMITILGTKEKGVGRGESGAVALTNWVSFSRTGYTLSRQRFSIYKFRVFAILNERNVALQTAISWQLQGLGATERRRMYFKDICSKLRMRERIRKSPAWKGVATLKGSSSISRAPRFIQ